MKIRQFGIRLHLSCMLNADFSPGNLNSHQSKVQCSSSNMPSSEWYHFTYDISLVTWRLDNQSTCRTLSIPSNQLQFL
ncbi:unnamed protein product [Blumeria hordei]|uniref:Uncharacterized protein n=1 Tax=Blumeria hordei TaxID=2867405 RepID=A0A383UNB0_BLUHO|nr:unnamed protein product [Blumeria hordei]